MLELFFHVGHHGNWLPIPQKKRNKGKQRTRGKKAKNIKSLSVETNQSFSEQRKSKKHGTWEARTPDLRITLTLSQIIQGMRPAR